VMLQTATSGGSIYYTTDGSAPTQSSTLYVGAFALTSSATVKAIAFKSGSNPSAVASAAFTVVTPPAQFTLTWQDNSTNESNFGCRLHCLDIVRRPRRGGELDWRISTS
jgi:hypothetical protein